MHDDRKNLEFYMAAALEVADKAFELAESDAHFIIHADIKSFTTSLSITISFLLLLAIRISARCQVIFYFFTSSK